VRLVFVQFGNHGEAARRLGEGGPETFYGQRHSVSFVESLAQRCEDVSVVHVSSDDVEERLPSGVRTVGLHLYPEGQRPRLFELIRLLERLRPDHLVVCTPFFPIIGWALARGIRTLPVFADSFRAKGFKATLKTWTLARLLNSRSIDWVSNHNVAASLELVRIGVKPDKVLPVDWPALSSPADRPSKELRSGDPLRMIFVGQVTIAKGVDDLIEAVRLIQATPNRRPWTATIVGKHDGKLARRAEELGLGALIDFVGPVPHDDVVPLMNQHDAVIVPSRHESSEGLPMTIYEGLCSRTPLVASDHPMFSLKLRPEVGALIFRAGDPSALAAQLGRLGDDPDLYARLSQAADATAADFHCPLKFDQLISRWAMGSAEDRRSLSGFSLASGRYRT
jgi:glycosyltransferase involved in cell wall biosynthesis